MSLFQNEKAALCLFNSHWLVPALKTSWLDLHPPLVRAFNEPPNFAFHSNLQNAEDLPRENLTTPRRFRILGSLYTFVR